MHWKTCFIALTQDLLIHIQDFLVDSIKIVSDIFRKESLALPLGQKYMKKILHSKDMTKKCKHFLQDHSQKK